MRVHKELSFVLHARPYSETSLFVDLFSRHYGRLTVIAKGARRQKSKFRGVLLPFRQLQTGWSGKGEMPVLTLAEPTELWAEMRGRTILCGFYMNELMMRLLHRHDAHVDLFDHYADTIMQLRSDGPREEILRLFEKRLLGEIGYALSLEFEAGSNREIDPATEYLYVPQLGAVTAGNGRRDGVPITGASLRALGRETFSGGRDLWECKRLMRVMISHQLDNRPLHSRKLFR